MYSLQLKLVSNMICSLLPKTGNTNQIALFIFYDVCFGVTMGTMELCNIKHEDEMEYRGYC